MDYVQIYECLINRARSENRVRNCGCIYENHHIIPKCIGGTNKKENLVLLTLKEHYIAHKLLVEIFRETTVVNRLYYAMWCLINGVGRFKRYSPSARIYERHREEWRLNKTPLFTGIKKIVLQYTLGGEFLRKFNSVIEATRITNISRSSIEGAARGETLSGGNFIWVYEKDLNTGKIIKPVIRKKSGRKKGSKFPHLRKKSDIICNKQSLIIYQYDLNGFFLKKWDCAKLASIVLKINRDSIWNNLTHKSKSSGEYIWSYDLMEKLDSYKPNKSGRKIGSIPWNKK